MPLAVQVIAWLNKEVNAAQLGRYTLGPSSGGASTPPPSTLTTGLAATLSGARTAYRSPDLAVGNGARTSRPVGVGQKSGVDLGRKFVSPPTIGGASTDARVPSGSGPPYNVQDHHAEKPLPGTGSAQGPVGGGNYFRRPASASPDAAPLAPETLRSKASAPFTSPAAGGGWTPSVGPGEEPAAGHERRPRYETALPTSTVRPWA